LPGGTSRTERLATTRIKLRTNHTKMLSHFDKPAARDDLYDPYEIDDSNRSYHHVDKGVRLLLLGTAAMIY